MSWGATMRGLGSGVALALLVAGCGRSGAESGSTVREPGSTAGESGAVTGPADAPVGRSEAPAPAEDPGTGGDGEPSSGEEDPGDREPETKPDRKKPGRPIRRPRDPKAACAEVGGRWRQFRNTCVDSCRRVRSPEPVACGMALTMGCDCGPDRCWNGATCVPNGASPGKGAPPSPSPSPAPGPGRPVPRPQPLR